MSGDLSQITHCLCESNNMNVDPSIMIMWESHYLLALNQMLRSGSERYFWGLQVLTIPSKTECFFLVEKIFGFINCSLFFQILSLYLSLWKAAFLRWAKTINTIKSELFRRSVREVETVENVPCSAFYTDTKKHSHWSFVGFSGQLQLVFVLKWTCTKASEAS